MTGSTQGINPYEAIFASMRELPESIRIAHAVPLAAAGEVDIERGHGVIPRLLAWLMRLPPAGKACPVRIEVSEAGSHVRWLRRFGSHTTCTYQCGCADGVREFVSVGSVVFGLTWSRGRLLYRSTQMRLLGIKLPARFAPRIEAAVADAGTAGWHVCVAVRTAGGRLVCRYAGNIAPNGRSDLAAAGAG